jgi:hypothetical protein
MNKMFMEKGYSRKPVFNLDETYVKFKHKLEIFMAPCKEVYNDMQIKEKQ